jgi:hypothetical protein
MNEDNFFQKEEVFWDVTPCQVVNSYRLFEEEYCLYLQGQANALLFDPDGKSTPLFDK